MNRSTQIAALLLALALPLAARADDASLRAKAEQLMNQQNTQKSIQQIAASINSQLSDAADRSAGPDATADQKAKVEAFKKQAAQLIETNIGWDAMKSSLIDLYAKAFTEEQLDQILAFYKTPAGAALLEKMPALNTEFGALGNTRINALRDQLQKAYQDLQSSLHPIPTLGSPASPPPATPGAAK